MTIVQVTIKGTTALLQNRFTESSELPGSTRAALIRRPTPKEEATKCAYIDERGAHWFPGAAIGRLLREAGSNHKVRGTRRSAKFTIPSAVLVMDDAITLLAGDVPITDFEVDSRPVVIPSTKGRIMRHRPRHDTWGAQFSLRINDQILPADFVHQLLNEGGQQIGIGDFRPEKGGPFGTFSVVSWAELKK